MGFTRRLAVLVVAAVASALVVVPAGASIPTSRNSGGLPPSDITAECPAPAPGHYTCYALRRTNLRARAAGPTPAGFGPAELQSAYHLPSATAGAGQTVYVIDAFGYPDAEKDLAIYRSRYGLSPCTTANGCFTKLNQDGATSPLPDYDPGWAAETALDLDMVSATCPKCHITLIEANDNSDNLFGAVATATARGAKYVSMSWGGPEDGSEPTYDATYFNQTGIVFTAAAGDGAYSAGVSYPSTSPNVVAVGGTSLARNGSTRGWSESVWGTDNAFGTGSGCSGDETKPSWQAIVAASVCSHRAGNDVAAVGDPYTGVAVYQQGQGGWTILGGTSASAPIIASVYALAGSPGPGDRPGSYPYAAASSLNDVTAGHNGTCSPGLLCTAATGWDGPTGLGTPQGVTAFEKPAHAVTVSNPGTQTSSTHRAVSLQISAAASPPGPTSSFAATGLPTGLTMSKSGLISGTPTAAGLFSVRVTATDNFGATGFAYFRWRVVIAGSFSAVTASRLLDTRNGIGVAAGPVPAGGSVAVGILGRGGVPAAGVSSVVLNVTVTGPAAAGYLTVHADGQTRPNTSNLNFAKGQTVANLVVAPVGTDGKVRLFSSTRAQVIADVSGYFLAGSPTEHGAFASLPPARLLDTRHGIGAADGPPATGSSNPATPSLRLAVLGRGGVPSSHVSAVVLNVTATGATSSGYVTAYPSGTSRPGASTLNFASGTTVPNLVVVPVGADGKVALDIQGGGRTVNLLADVFGYYTDGTPSAPGTLAALSPARVLDTRNGTGTGGAVVRVGQGETLSLQVTGHGGVPGTGVAAVVLNVVASNPTGFGYLTVYSADALRPGASNLNYVQGQTVANLVMVPVSAGGKVNLTVNGQGTTSLIADVAGYYLAGG